MGAGVRFSGGPRCGLAVGTNPALRELACTGRNFEAAVGEAVVRLSADAKSSNREGGRARGDGFLEIKHVVCSFESMDGVDGTALLDAYKRSCPYDHLCLIAISDFAF